VSGVSTASGVADGDRENVEHDSDMLPVCNDAFIVSSEY